MIVTILLMLGCSTSQTVVKEEDREDEAPEQVDPPEPEIEEPIPEEQPKPEPEDKVELISYSELPETPREFRGAWIATVDNIDWPSKPGLSVAQQKAELRAMMDRAQLLNMNAIVFQVRPSADALYDSPYEPWSEYLTGQQGKAPEPYYDPLKFAVEEAHRRGLELHAWFNPFRAYHPAAEGDFAPGHIKNRHPDMVVKYGRYLWLDPGQPRVRQYSIDVIADVVRRYDIDGVHLDDYFYPYPVTGTDGKDTPFPDLASYKKYMRENGSVKRGDWRRQNVNQFIERLSQEIKLIDPQVRFGISPFGIWRPGHPEQIKGFDAFDRLYADARKWLHEGWVDYLAPQLYWPIEQKPQSFPVLLDWWSQQNIRERHIWPGLYTSKLRSVQEKWPTSEIERQIRITQANPDATGTIHFSMKALMQNPDKLSGHLLTDVYQDEALVPATSWIKAEKPPEPSATLQQLGSKFSLMLHTKQGFEPWLWIVKKKYGSHWSVDVHPGWKQSIVLSQANRHGSFVGAAISVVDKLGNESVHYLIENPNYK
ncbi:glycoside hydrolase family 10 protein [Fodinibius salsisoli]|uniref:Family 10 glycosylhydrolase n=1 Tax=Fodinibius salsisoli TaxID=2820877 RepID=A0ABT3PKK8_9BACT|nr:family 10 glycosylhydrolase [Fodinibius salsisoli]MCW9706473.1 family 10 glycosylhydrolase [Fodinibius salsisoli]